MIILAVECSAVSVGVAVLKDESLECDLFENNGHTHSVTLLPQIDMALKTLGLSVSDIDVFAVSGGPGSFTGLRIGAATVKGLCAGGALCMSVSTLEAMAYCHIESDCVICPCMDARCSQVYNALFKSKDGKIERLCEDRAMLLHELQKELLKSEFDKILLVGDGAAITYEYIAKSCPELLKKVCLEPEETRLQRASGVALSCRQRLLEGEKAVAPEQLKIEYLRLPQAERELKKKEKTQ